MYNLENYTYIIIFNVIENLNIRSLEFRYYKLKAFVTS